MGNCLYQAASSTHDVLYGSHQRRLCRADCRCVDFLQGGGVTKDFLLDLMFYIIITPIISVTLTRIMFQSENAMIVDDALHRIDSVLNLNPLAEAAQPEHPNGASVQLNHVHFSYDGKKRGHQGYFPFQFPQGRRWPLWDLPAVARPRLPI